MPPNELKAWAEIIEIALRCLAIVGAGVWALLVLILLRQREQVQTGLRKTEAEVKSLELQSRQQAVVRVDINTSTHRAPDSNGYIVVATIDLANRGSRNTRV